MLITGMFLLRLGLAAIALAILSTMFEDLESDGSLSLYLAEIFSFAFTICSIAFIVLTITHLGERRSKP